MVARILLYSFSGPALFALLFRTLAWLLFASVGGFLPASSLLAGELEQVVVSGRKPVAADGEDVHGFTSYTRMDELLTAPANLAEVVNKQPGVAYTGQGGLFQTVSIRGLARQRVGSYFLDIPLLSERRAGTAASFIDPKMLGSVELVRGPASTSYGAGNIGSLYAGLLKESGQDVSILARGKRLADIRDHGIRLANFVAVVDISANTFPFLHLVLLWFD